MIKSEKEAHSAFSIAQTEGDKRREGGGNWKFDYVRHADLPHERVL